MAEKQHRLQELRLLRRTLDAEAARIKAEIEMERARQANSAAVRHLQHKSMEAERKSIAAATRRKLLDARAEEERNHQSLLHKISTGEVPPPSAVVEDLRSRAAVVLQGRSQ